MDRFLREAVVAFLKERKLDTEVLSTAEKRTNFNHFCENMKLDDNGRLLYKGRRHGFRSVPTSEQVDSRLFKVHVKGYKEGESDLGKAHYRGTQKHIDALSNAGWHYP